MTCFQVLAMAPFALAQAASAVADTVVTVQATSTGLQRWVDLMTSIASIVIALALIALSIALIPAAWNSRKTYRHINQLVQRVQNQADPILVHAQAVADNVNYLTTAVRTDMERFQGTIRATQERLDRAAEQTEERINEFNALLKVVQEEAEELFIDTAATLRGVQAGTRALRHQPSPGLARAHEGDEDEDVEGIRPGPRRHL